MMDLITSTSNQKIKEIRKLLDRKERSATGQFLVEGLRIVIEALQQKMVLVDLVVAPDLLRSEKGSEWIHSFRQEHPEKVIQVSPEVFRSFSQKDGPQGVAAVLSQQWINLREISWDSNGCWVALDAVADPGNLGTIMRTIDAAGARGVILLDQSTDPYDPTAIRGSMGAILSVPHIKTTFAEFETWVKSNQVPVIGTSDKGVQNYHSIRYPNPMILLMGSERQGLDQHHLDLCSEIVAIPMRGRSDSLNLSVATGIILYEIDHQLRTISGTEGKSV